jgi:RNA polymerase sigma factor (sigma-70 family)
LSGAVSGWSLCQAAYRLRTMSRFPSDTVAKFDRSADTHVMNWSRLRSTGVSTAAVATASGKIDESRVAFEALYRESRDDVYAYVAGLVRDRSAAEEVTSQAFERAWRKRRQIDKRRGTPRAWLFGIARNAALDELRRRTRITHSDPETGPTLAANPAEIAVDRAALQQALESLSGRERELVALKYFAGLSNAEIAAVTRTSETNAGTRLHRVIEKLRRSIDEAD